SKEHRAPLAPARADVPSPQSPALRGGAGTRTDTPRANSPRTARPSSLVWIKSIQAASPSFRKTRRSRKVISLHEVSHLDIDRRIRVIDVRGILAVAAVHEVGIGAAVEGVVAGFAEQ